MRSISIRQFQHHLYEELASLPFTVTRKGKPSFNVTTIEKVTTSDVTTIKTVGDAKKVVEKFTLNVCKHGFRKGLCKFGC